MELKNRGIVIKTEDFNRFKELRKEKGLLAHQLFSDMLKAYVEKQEKESDKQ